MPRVQSHSIPTMASVSLLHPAFTHPFTMHPNIFSSQKSLSDCTKHCRRSCLLWIPPATVPSTWTDKSQTKQWFSMGDPQTLNKTGPENALGDSPPQYPTKLTNTFAAWVVEGKGPTVTKQSLSHPFQESLLAPPATLLLTRPWHLVPASRETKQTALEVTGPKHLVGNGLREHREKDWATELIALPLATTRRSRSSQYCSAQNVASWSSQRNLYCSQEQPTFLKAARVPSHVWAA